MARFSVPSTSPPSTPSSRTSKSSSCSPSGSPIDTYGPTRFEGPGGLPFADGSQCSSSRSPAPTNTDGPIRFEVLNGMSSTGSGSQRSRSLSISPMPRKAIRGEFCPAQTRGTRPDGVVRPLKRAASPGPEKPAQRQRQSPRGNDQSKKTTRVPKDVSCGSDGSDHGSTDFFSNGDDSDRDGGTGNDSNDGAPHYLSNHTDAGLSAQGKPEPLDLFFPPSRRIGGLRVAQPTRSRALVLSKEHLGALPTHSRPEHSSTWSGFNWGNGAAWWSPKCSQGTQNIVREISRPYRNGTIMPEVAGATAQLMNHENLIKILGREGFESGQPSGKKGVLYELWRHGTLNKLILSRRPRASISKPRRSATQLPKEPAELGLPEDLVWHVLLSLLRAAYWLHAQAQPVVHCAIDPANVFFTAPKPNDERPLVRKYGLVKLGNFSRAVILPHKRDPDGNDREAIYDWCEMFRHLITEPYQETGFEAPELLGMIGEDQDSIKEKVVPSACSDLFSIGVTCFAMMTGGKTIWDHLLERRFIDRSRSPDRVDSASLPEKLSFVAHGDLTALLTSILQHKRKAGDTLALGDALDLCDAMPAFYSSNLRDFVREELLQIHPDSRGESALLLDIAEDTFAARCAEAVGDGLGEMRKA